MCVKSKNIENEKRGVSLYEKMGVSLYEKMGAFSLRSNIENKLNKYDSYNDNMPEAEKGIGVIE